MGSYGFIPIKKSVTSLNLLNAKMFISLIKLASGILSIGTITFLIPLFLASITIGNTPTQGLKSPFNDNSPIKAYLSTSSTKICADCIKRAIAIPKSK